MRNFLSIQISEKNCTLKERLLTIIISKNSVISSLDLMDSFASIDLQMINFTDYATLNTVHVKLVLPFTIKVLISQLVLIEVKSSVFTWTHFLEVLEDLCKVAGIFKSAGVGNLIDAFIFCCKSHGSTFKSEVV